MIDASATPSRLANPFRKDIEGMRALAVVLVLLYHAGVRSVGGGFVGVDVFFVVSGYLITGLLVRELDTTGSIQLLSFYAKRARRLLPASFTVITFVAAVIYIAPRWVPDLIAPQLYGRSISWDIQRSATYVVNWLFAERSISYQAGTELASPLQHFWSLSVEEQFYAVWPALLLGVSVVSRSSKRVLAGCLTIITIVSLVFSYRLTRDMPEQAYFVTTTRVWEMSLGGLAAMASPIIDRAVRTRGWGEPAVSRVAAIAGVAGLFAIALGATWFDETTPYPGLAALLPTLGASMMLVAMPHCATSLLSRLLAAEPMQWIGARSYSIYLWHWPALWLATAIEGSLTTPVALAVVAVSILPAMASYALIEQPARSATFLIARPIRGIALTAGTAVAGYAIGLLLLSTTADRPPGEQEIAAPEITTEVAGIQLEVEDMVPSAIDARFDLPAGYADGCIADRSATLDDPCSYGNIDSDTTVLVVGNSHAGHWTPAFAELAETYDWHLLTNIRSSCRLPVAIAGPGLCDQWADRTQTELQEVVDSAGVDLVVTMPNAFSEPGYSNGEVEQLYTEAFSAFGDLDVPAVVIHPTPHGKVIGIDCPSLLRSDLGDCATPIDDAMTGTASIVAAARASNLDVVDMTSFLCNDATCPAVIDDVLVRRDRHHLTRTFVVALTTPLADKLEQVVPEVFAAVE